MGNAVDVTGSGGGGGATMVSDGCGGGVGGFVVSDKVVIVCVDELSVIAVSSASSVTNSDRSAFSADVPVLSKLNGEHAGGDPC